MHPLPYPFLDIAVLDPVRARLLSGEALIVLDANGQNLIWADGNATSFFGAELIETWNEHELAASGSTGRQLAAIGVLCQRSATSRGMIRHSKGVKTKALTVNAQRINLPGSAHGTSKGILLVLSRSDKNADMDTQEARSQLLEKFAADDVAAALLDESGGIVGATPSLQAMGVGKDALKTLSGDLGAQEDRLIKQPIQTEKGRMPAGLGRISDKPVIDLLLVVDEPIDEPAKTATQKQAEEDQSNEPAKTNEPDGSRESFVFDPTMQPRRFVWKLDANGHFSTLSEELALVVGPLATDVIGRSFHEVATSHGFDDDGVIAGLLERQDTWSGKSIFWPVQATALRVPIDLAALPIYDRQRQFQGYRGFGVVRPGSAEQDPTASGLTMTAQEPSQAAPDRNHQELSSQIKTEGTHSATDDSPEESTRLTQIGRKASDPLSDTETAAFLEIGARLSVDKENSSLPRPDNDDEAGPDEPSRHDRKRNANAAPPLDDDPLRTILSRLPLPVIVLTKSEPTYANHAFLELTQFDDLADLKVNGGMEALFEEPGFAANADDGAHIMSLKAKGGTQVPVRIRMRAITLEGTRSLMLSLEREERQGTVVRFEGLHDHAFEIEAVLDTAIDGVVLLSGDGAIRSLNRSACALFGRDSEEMTGAPFTDLMAEESRGTARDYLKSMDKDNLAGLLNQGREIFGLESAGGLIPLFMTLGRLPGSGGFCALFQDRTAWKRTEEDLVESRRRAERASAQKSTFLASVSHEIRTPLNAIIGFAEIMAEESFGAIGNERYRGYIRDIRKSGQHVLEIVNDLLDLSKIEAGQQDMAIEPVVLGDVLSESISIMQPEALRHGVIVRTSIAGGIPAVMADLRAVRQIALNVIANAIHYTPSGGQVIVSVANQPSGEVVMRVRDTGIGMTKREIDQALKPFGQIANLASDRRRGTGLGLPLTKAMVEGNRALFEITSEPGKGTLVEITFPVQRVVSDQN